MFWEFSLVNFHYDETFWFLLQKVENLNDLRTLRAFFDVKKLKSLAVFFDNFEAFKAFGNWNQTAKLMNWA